MKGLASKVAGFGGLGMKSESWGKPKPYTLHPVAHQQAAWCVAAMPLETLQLHLGLLQNVLSSSYPALQGATHLKASRYSKPPSLKP